MLQESKQQSMASGLRKKELSQLSLLMDSAEDPLRDGKLPLNMIEM